MFLFAAMVIFLLGSMIFVSKDTSAAKSSSTSEISVPDWTDCTYYYYEPDAGLRWTDTVLYNPLVCPLCGDPIVLEKVKCGSIYI